MDKVYLIVSLAVLAGCAATQPEPGTAVAAPIDGGALQAAALAAPAAVLEIADFTSSTVCKDVTVTGSRLERGELCTTTDVDPNLAAFERRRREWEIEQINRRSSAEIERQRRESLRAQFPMRNF